MASESASPLPPAGHNEAASAGGGTRWPVPAIATICAVLLAVFLMQNMFLVLLPVSLQASGLATGITIGLLVALSEGLGILFAPPAASYGDRHGHGKLLKIGGIATALSMLGLAIATVFHSIWLWILPIVVYALGRTPIMVSALAVVNAMPQPLRMQGINGAVQRAAAIIGALLASVLIVWGQWHWGFGALGLIAAALYTVARRLPPPRAPRARQTAPRHSYPVSLQLLRTERALQASSLVNLANRTVIVLGNAFFPLAIGVNHADLAGWVLLFLAARDLTSVAFGFTFRTLVERLGLRGAQAVTAASSVSGLLIIGIGSTTILTVTLGAALQGIAVFIAIGSANLLATAGSPATGRTLRLASTFYPVSIASMVFPTAFGTVLHTWGGSAVFLVGAGVIAALNTAVIAMVGSQHAAGRSTTG